MGEVVSSVVSGVFGNKAAKKQADAQLEAAQIAAEQFRPYNVNTGYGSVQVSGQGPNKRLSFNLSPEVQAMGNMFLGEASQGLDEAASLRYDQLAALSARGEADARRQNEAALFRSGRLGTYAGMRQTGEVETALANARLSRELASYDYASQLRQNALVNYINTQQGMTGALGVLSANRNPAAPMAAAGMVNAGNTMASFYGQAGKQIASGINDFAESSGFNQWASDTIGSIFSSPSSTVQIAQTRQDAFIAEMARLKQEGESEADAFLQAAEVGRERGWLAPDEYLNAKSAGLAQAKIERDFLARATKEVLSSKAVRDYQSSASTFKQLVQLAGEGQAGEQGANDFVLIQQGFKVLDPNSQVTQDELRTGQLSAKNQAAFNMLGIKLNQIINFSAGKGNRLELTAKQKERWLSAIARAVNAKRDAAESVYLANRDAFVAAAGSNRKFESAMTTTRNLLSYDAVDAVRNYATDKRFSPGLGFPDNATRIIAGLENMNEVYGPILKGVGGALWDSASGLIFGDNEDGPNLREGAAPRMRGGFFKQFAPGELPKSSGALTRVLANDVIDNSLMSAYQTENVMHARTMDLLYNNSVGNVVDGVTARQAAKMPKRPRRI